MQKTFRKYSDRFISERSKKRDQKVQKYIISNDKNKSINTKSYSTKIKSTHTQTTSSLTTESALSNKVYSSLLKSQLFSNSSINEKILAISDTLQCIKESNTITHLFTGRKRERSLNNQNIDYYNNYNTKQSNHSSYFNMVVNEDDSFSFDDFIKTTTIKSSPIKVLDAPGLRDDYYLHLLDWSKDDILAVGLRNTIYFWENKTGKVTEVASFNNLCSLAWLEKNHLLSIGLLDGQVIIFDVIKMKEVISYKKHQYRVGVIAKINNNENSFSSGSLDSNIITYDLRYRSLSTRFKGHKQEVCGLKWSPDGKTLASGGNDNKLLLWTLNSNRPCHEFNKHTSAIRALDWSHRKYNMLCSGGGIQDRMMYFWNCSNMTFIDFIETSSQVCNLAFSKFTNELVSTHGFSDNSICVWNMNKKKKIAQLDGHWNRVLYMAYSPFGKTIVTGSADETLRFWDVFKHGNSSIDLDLNNINNANLCRIR